MDRRLKAKIVEQQAVKTDVRQDASSVVQNDNVAASASESKPDRIQVKDDAAREALRKLIASHKETRATLRGLCDSVEQVSENLDVALDLIAETQDGLKRLEDRVSVTEKALKNPASVQQPVAVVETASVSRCPNGPGVMFRYWDYRMGQYKYKTEFWAAYQASGGEVDKVYVMYENGAPREMTSAELDKYCP